MAAPEKDARIGNRQGHMLCKSQGKHCCRESGIIVVAVLAKKAIQSGKAYKVRIYTKATVECP